MPLLIMRIGCMKASSCAFVRELGEPSERALGEDSGESGSGLSAQRPPIEFQNIA